MWILYVLAEIAGSEEIGKVEDKTIGSQREKIREERCGETGKKHVNGQRREGKWGKRKKMTSRSTGPHTPTQTLQPGRQGISVWQL